MAFSRAVESVASDDQIVHTTPALSARPMATENLPATTGAEPADAFRLLTETPAIQLTISAPSASVPGASPAIINTSSTLFPPDGRMLIIIATTDPLNKQSFRDHQYGKDLRGRHIGWLLDGVTSGRHPVLVG